MTYAQYQVWFHAFNNAYAALCRTIKEQEPDHHTLRSIRSEAAEVADFILKKFEEVKMPEAPDMSGIDLQGLVNKVAQNVIKTKAG